MLPQPLERLIDELTKLPGIGPKTAQRLAFYLLESPEKDVKFLADTMVDAKRNLTHCGQCFTITDRNPCSFCRDSKRDQAMVCVVAEPKDLMALEKTHEFKGTFHVLGGLISPLDGIGPDDIRIRELLLRLEPGKIQEIIVATNPSATGEATALYLAKLIKPLGVKVTRLACGLPMGADLEYADEVTLSKALEGRREI
jgi:recombination protein RecR